MPVASLRTDPTNPRSISKAMFARLKTSMTDDPDFLWHRPILANGDGVIYAGTMRYRAAVELGREVVPAIIEDVSPAVMRARRMKDNLGYGDWDDEKLAEEVYALREEGVDLGVLGFEDKEVARILALSGADGEANDHEERQVTCPSCGNTFAP